MNEKQIVAAATSMTSRGESFALRADAYRRQRADEAIAYIERCYRERRPIPNLH